MVVDPDELLIFKMRGVKEHKPPQPQAKKPAPQPTAQPAGKAQPSVKQEIPQPASSAEKIVPASANQQVSPISQGAMQPKEAKQPTVAVQEQKAPSAQNYQPAYYEAAAQKTATQTPKEAVKPRATSNIERTMAETSVISQLLEESSGAEEPNIGAKQSKRLTKSQKGSIDAAKGLKCVNHPWRDAYAICDYCHRPFCYADIVEYNGKFYCLEDIDKVSSTTAAKMENPNSKYTSISSAFFIITAVILGYFTYPQAAVLLNYMHKVGLSYMLSNLTYGYAISLMNFAIVLFSVVGGIVVLTKSQKGFYLGAMIGLLMLIAVSYEYLNSSIDYLLVVTVTSLASVSLLAYGRVVSSNAEFVSEISNEEVNWPSLETF